jgi:hypothetical protein
MGTLQNRLRPVFHAIAEACARLNVQLVISLGAVLHPDELGRLAGNPVVVEYAPQLELMRRSALAISHGGLNTVLEALSCGVPQVVIPVTWDRVPGAMDWCRRINPSAEINREKAPACSTRRARESSLSQIGPIPAGLHH